MGTLLGDTLREAGRRFGARPALVAPAGWMLGYAELDALVDRVVAGLAAEGLRPGDVVGLVLPSGPEYVVAYLAAARIGAVTAGVNPRFPASERQALLDVVDPAVVLGTAELLDEVVHDAPALRLGLAGTRDELEEVLPGRPPDDAPATPTDHDPRRPVALVFTSGTTGPPKAAVFTDRQLEAITRLDHGVGWGGGGPMLVATEPVHVGFMTKLAWYLRAGMTMGLLRHWRAHDALEFIARHRVLVVGGIPAQLALMLREPDFDQFDLSAVTTLVTGGSAVSPTLLDEATRRFGAGFSVRYSSTESGGVGTATDATVLDEGRSSVGRSRDGVRVRVVDDDGVPLPPGEVGAVELASPAIMDGYHRDPEATARVSRGEWLRMGDAGHLGEDGLLRLAGRDSEMYIRGGYNVHPQRVEAALQGHPGVAGLVVVPRADEVMGEIGVAVVEPADPARPPTLEDLRAHGRTRLARHELPEDVVVVDRVPLTSLHKLDRQAAARLVRSGGSTPGGQPTGRRA